MCEYARVTARAGTYKVELILDLREDVAHLARV
jgi:hypothetical protein